MTQKERIEQLEAKIKELEWRLAAVEARPQYIPMPSPSPTAYPWQTTWGMEGSTSFNELRIMNA